MVDLVQRVSSYIMYYEIYCDHNRIGCFDRIGKDSFVQDNKKKYHLLQVVYYDKNHLNVGCEDYIDGKLIYSYSNDKPTRT